MYAEIDLSEAARIVKELGVPACPAVLADLMQEATKEEPELSNLNRLISSDAGLSEVILKSVNSPIHAPSQKASTIQEAMATLGLGCGIKLVARLMLRRGFTASGDPAMTAFWDSTAEFGLIIAYLARELGVADFDDAHTFGFFRDCGAPLLVRKFPDYRRWYEVTHTHGAQDIARTERARYGFDHASVGALLAKNWGLPESIWLPISLHHHRDEIGASAAGGNPTQRLIAIGVLADWVRWSNGTPGRSAFWEQEQVYAYRVLGVRPEEMDSLRSDISLLLQGQ